MYKVYKNGKKIGILQNNQIDEFIDSLELEAASIMADCKKEEIKNGFIIDIIPACMLFKKTSFKFIEG